MSPGNETLKRVNQLDLMLHKKSATNSSESGKRKTMLRKLTRASKTPELKFEKEKLMFQT